MSDSAMAIFGTLFVAGTTGVVALLWRIGNQVSTVLERMSAFDARLQRLESKERT